jgi:predicted nucleic acid-binding protein
MSLSLVRLFLDTNVYILGAIDSSSFERQILDWLDRVDPNTNPIELLVSEALLIQVARVARRLSNKDWAGKLVDRIVSYPNVCYILLDDNQIEHLQL